MFIRLLEIITKNRIKFISMFEKNCSKIFIRFFESILAKSILWFRLFKRIGSHDPIQNRFFLGEPNICALTRADPKKEEEEEEEEEE